MPETTQEIPEPIPKRSDERKFVRNWAFLRMAHEAMVLAKIMRQNKYVEAQAKFAATGDKKDLVVVPSEGEDEMNIGNEIHNHYQGPPPATNGQTPQTAQPSNGTLGKVLLGAALMGGGLGAGYLGNELLRDDPPAAVDTDTDTDTQTDVVFPD